MQGLALVARASDVDTDTLRGIPAIGLEGSSENAFERRRLLSNSGYQPPAAGAMMTPPRLKRRR